MTYPHNCVDSKVNNPLHKFLTKKELLQTYQVHSLRHHSRCCRPELGPMFISTQFQKKACMNPVESIAVQESGNNLLSCTSVLTSGCRMKLYYPLYSGWSFPCMPHFFLCLARHVLGHSQDSRGMACQTFVSMVFTQNSSSLSGSFSQTTPLFKSVPKMTSFPPTKKLISSEGASFSIYLTCTIQAYRMSESIPQSSVS